MKGWLRSAIGWMALATASPSFALDTLTIANPAQIRWAVLGNTVFLRNLNEFDPSWLGCCYNYWIDVSSDGGRAMFSAFLTARATNSPMSLSVPDKTVASALNQLGNW